jgi:hypothetical protein
MRPGAAFLRAAVAAIATTAVGGCLLLAGTQGLTGGTPPDAAAEAGVAEGGSTEASADAGSQHDARSDGPSSDAGTDAIGDAAVRDSAVGDAAGDAPPPPTLVQQVTGTATDAGAVTLTLPAPPSAGDMLLLATANGDMSPTSVMGPGATWTQLAESGVHVVASMWTAAGVTGAAQTVTIAWTPATSSFAGSLSEWKGVSTYVASQTDYATGPVTTASIGASPGQLVVASGAMHGPEDNDMVTGPSGGFTALQYAGIAHVAVLAAYLDPSSPGVYLAQWTQTVSADGWDTIIATFGP